MQSQRPGEFQLSTHTVTAPAPSPPDLEAFLMDDQLPRSRDGTNQPLATIAGNSPFPNFTFPYKDSSDSPDMKLEQGIATFDFPTSAVETNSSHGHRRSISSTSPSGLGIYIPNEGSEVASPDSGRAGNKSAVDMFNDDFGLNSGNGDGNDAGTRPKDENNGQQPLWSELKTKAGKERKRLPLACIACRRKKIRCSGEKPACKHCLRSRIPCVYKVTTRKAAPRTDYMAMLDKRLKRMEERIIKIAPKDDQDFSPVTRAVVKPALPGTIPARGATGKKRNSDEAFGAELESWTKPAAPRGSMDAAAKSASVLIHEAEENKLLTEGAEVLPDREMQEHLAEVFFECLYGQTYHLLHKPSFMRKLSAGTVPPVLVLTVCAVSARFSNHPSLDSPTPAFLRGENWASAARDIVVKRYEWPNITILTCLLLLGLHEFGTCQGGRSWSLGGQAIRMAYALQLHRDLDHDPLQRKEPVQLSFIDREIRRRTLWACFLMDRFNSSGTERPTFMKEESIKVQLPIKEKLFQSDMSGPTENLFGEVVHPVPPEAGHSSNAEDNMGVAAFMIRVIALWGRIINYLNLGGRELDKHDIWHPESQFLKLMKQADEFNSTLPEALKYTPENMHTHEVDKIANQFLFLHITIQQNILFMNRFAVPRHPGGRPPSEMPKDFVSKAGAKAFEAANRISEILRDAESKFVVAPFTGYCAFLSSTVQMFGVFSSNQLVATTSKQNLAVNVKYLSKMKKYWGMFHYMTENLKELYRACADASKHGQDSKAKDSTIFQYGDWFDRYPHGVSHSDYEDPATAIKKEKGDDAVLEQKSDYHTVEEFFSSLSPSQQPTDVDKQPKRKPVKKNSSNKQEQGRPAKNNIPKNAAVTELQQQIPRSGTELTPPMNGNHMNPTSQPPTDVYAQAAFYPPNDLFLPPHQQGGMLQQLDRQLVFGAYGGMEPSSIPNQPIMDNPSNPWDMGNMGMGNSFVSEPTAWFMPFNMEPPEIGHDTDFFNGNMSYGMDNLGNGATGS